MKRFATRALYATLFTGGLMLLGAGVANASETSGDDAILSGSQLGISIELPVTVSGNAVSVIGDSSSSDAATEVSTADAGSAAEADMAEAEPVAVTSGDDGVGSGSQAIVDVSAPVTVGGNAVSVIGDSSSEDATTAVSSTSGPAGADSASTSGEDSILGGTQGIVDVAAPITIGGNAVSVIGDSSTEDARTVVTTGPGSSSGTDATTSGEDSILGGTQLVGDIRAPITIGGNAVSVIGDSSTEGSTTVVNPADPADPVNPVDPTEPTDPVDPADPVTPTTPVDAGGTGSTGSTVSTVSTGSTVSSVGLASPAAASTSGKLASTGTTSEVVALVALLLVVGGVLFAGAGAASARSRR